MPDLPLIARARAHASSIAFRAPQDGVTTTYRDLLDRLSSLVTTLLLLDESSHARGGCHPSINPPSVTNEIPRIDVTDQLALREVFFGEGSTGKGLRRVVPSQREGRIGRSSGVVGVPGLERRRVGTRRVRHRGL